MMITPDDVRAHIDTSMSDAVIESAIASLYGWFDAIDDERVLETVVKWVYSSPEGGTLRTDRFRMARQLDVKGNPVD